jgi:hypothetical protein
MLHINQIDSHMSEENTGLLFTATYLHVIDNCHH